MVASQIELHNDLISRCKQGDRAAQQEIYKLYALGMYNTAVRILNNREDARDIVQDAFVDMYLKLDSFRGESAFGAWFKRIVVNKSLNHLKRNQTIDLNEETLNIEAEEYEEPENYSVQDVKSAMSSLPKGYKLVFDLYMFEGMSHKEIASSMDISEATSKSQLSRAKQKVREFLNQKMQ